MKSRSLLLVIVCTFTLVVVFYAFMFMLVDDSLEGCGIAPKGQRASFYNAFAFALETLTTIGYAVPYDKGDFFNSCPGMLLLIYCGSITWILLNALIVGLIIGRLARASSRANQIIFSEKGSICCVRNRFYFLFQVCEASFFAYRPVVEANVRVYAVLHEQDPTSTNRAFFQTRGMRLTNPNDELGGKLFLATPQVVTHAIDQWSPLFPPRALARPSYCEDEGQGYHFPGVVYRESDREVAMAGEGRPATAVPPPAAHNVEGAEPKPAVGDSASEAELLAMQQEIRDHLSRSELEVIVVLEGIDPHTSSTFQARHSYTAQEIVFDQMFVPSLSVGRDGRAVFDWNAFHEHQPVPFNRRHLIFGAHS